MSTSIRTSITSDSTLADLADFLRTTSGTASWDRQSAWQACHRVADGRLRAILRRALYCSVRGSGAVETVMNNGSAWNSVERRVCRYLQVKPWELFQG